MTYMGFWCALNGICHLSTEILSKVFTKEVWTTKDAPAFHLYRIACLVSCSQILYLEKQRGKGLVKLPWQIGSDHTTIFEAFFRSVQTTMGNNLLVWYLAHTQHLKKPVRSEPICHGSPFPSAFRGKRSGYARLLHMPSPHLRWASVLLKERGVEYGSDEQDNDRTRSSI